MTVIGEAIGIDINVENPREVRTLINESFIDDIHSTYVLQERRTDYISENGDTMGFIQHTPSLVRRFYTSNRRDHCTDYLDSPLFGTGEFIDLATRVREFYSGDSELIRTSVQFFRNREITGAHIPVPPKGEEFSYRSIGNELDRAVKMALSGRYQEGLENGLREGRSGDGLSTNIGVRPEHISAQPANSQLNFFDSFISAGIFLIACGASYMCGRLHASKSSTGQNSKVL